MPATADEAVRIALANNPDLIAITRQAEAAGFDVQLGARHPPADRFGGRLGRLCHDHAATPAGLTAPARPPASACRAASRSTRAACRRRGSVRRRRSKARRSSSASATDAPGRRQHPVGLCRLSGGDWTSIKSNEVAVKANELALEGARAENSVGTRTILDVLNAEQELLNSQVALVTARREAYVAGFQLLNAMGQAEADDLGLDGGPLYDPLGNYRRVAGNWNDWSGDPRHPTRSRPAPSPRPNSRRA